MQIAFQVVTTILSVVASLQKKKWVMMLFLTINNISCIAMYFAFSRIATAALCIVASVRTIVYMLFALKNKKPDWMVLVIFEIGFVLAAIYTWQDPLDWLPLLALVIAGYTSWQDNTFILRLGYIVNPALYIVYKSIIGAYISIIPEAFMLIGNLIAIIYYNICKKEKPILSYFVPKKFLRQEEKVEGDLPPIQG